jgi:hypothetical protein
MGFIGARGLGTRPHEPGRGGCQKMDHRAQFHEDAAHCREGAKACQPTRTSAGRHLHPIFRQVPQNQDFRATSESARYWQPVVKSALQALSSSASSPGGRPALTVLELPPDVQCQGGASPARSRHPRAIYSFEREVGRPKSESGCVATSRTFVSSPRAGGQFDDERRHFPACRFGPSTGTARRPLVSTRESSHAGSAIASSML